MGGSEHRRVGVKTREVPGGGVGEGNGKRLHLVLLAPCAELVVAAPDPVGEMGDHAAHVVGDDHGVWMPVEEPGEDQPGHGDRGLVRPAEDLPEVVPRILLARVVREVGSPRRVEEDRHPPARRLLDHLERPWFIERPPRHVRVDLDADKSRMGGEPVQLPKACGRVVKRESAERPREAVGVRGHEAGEFIVGQPGEVGRDLGRSEAVDRRGGQR